MAKGVEYWIRQVPFIQEWASMHTGNGRTIVSEYDARRISNAMSFKYPGGIEGIGSIVATARELGIIPQGDEMAITDTLRIINEINTPTGKGYKYYLNGVEVNNVYAIKFETGFHKINKVELHIELKDITIERVTK